VLKLDEIADRIARATPGPWTAEPVFDEDERDRPDLEHYWDDHSEWAYNAEPFRIEGPEVVENGEFSALSGPDADFIAASRADIPALVAELRAARADLGLVHLALQHDRDCEEEGEGECCLSHWRSIVIAVAPDLARNVTGQELAALAAFRAVVGEQE
jgi:hypothetical protein